MHQLAVSLILSFWPIRRRNLLHSSNGWWSVCAYFLCRKLSKTVASRRSMHSKQSTKRSLNRRRRRKWLSRRMARRCARSSLSALSKFGWYCLYCLKWRANCDIVYAGYELVYMKRHTVKFEGLFVNCLFLCVAFDVVYFSCLFVCVAFDVVYVRKDPVWIFELSSSFVAHSDETFGGRVGRTQLCPLVFSIVICSIIVS